MSEPEAPPPGAEVLRQRAAADCLAHARQHLPGDLRVEAAPAARGWSDAHLGLVHEQPMTIHQTLLDLDVLVDEHDHVVGFVDRAAPRPCAPGEIEAEDLRRRLLETGVPSSEAVLVWRRAGAEGCVEALLRQRRLPRWLLARVDPGRGAVLSIEPLTEPPP